MSITAAELAEIRRMVNEPTTTTYSDALITSIADKYPMIDELGTMPYSWLLTSGVPTKTANADWIPTYDLNMSAAQIWREKASVVQARFDFSADGGDYTRSQEFVHADAMARFFLARSSVRTITQVIAIEEQEVPSWVGNLPEQD